MSCDHSMGTSETTALFNTSVNAVPLPPLVSICLYLQLRWQLFANLEQHESDALCPCRTVTVWRRVASPQVTCATALGLKEVAHKLKVLKAQPVGNQSVTTTTYK